MTAIWYMRPEFFRDGIMGLEWCREQGLAPDPQNLCKTHVYLTDSEITDLEHLFAQMQGENWSPNGEASGLIEERGLHHTSMSIGDLAVLDTGEVWIVDTVGFQSLGVRS